MRSLPGNRLTHWVCSWVLRSPGGDWSCWGLWRAGSDWSGQRFVLLLTHCCWNCRRCWRTTSCWSLKSCCCCSSGPWPSPLPSTLFKNKMWENKRHLHVANVHLNIKNDKYISWLQQHVGWFYTSWSNSLKTLSPTRYLSQCHPSVRGERSSLWEVSSWSWRRSC